MKKIYFAHPVNLYGQLMENAFIKLIAHEVASGELSLIENPNQPHHQTGYNNYAKRLKESGLDHKGMNYFYDEVLPNCDSCVGVPFLDGRIGLGVAGEMKWFIEHKKPTWLVMPTRGIISDDLKAFIINPLNDMFRVSPLTYEEKGFLVSYDVRFVVPHEETRLRTWRVYNRERRPYEKAHLVEMPVPEGFYPDS